MTSKKEIQVVDFKNLPVDFSSCEVTDAALAKLKEEYGQVPDCSTREGYATAKAGLAICRSLRGKVEARRKELNGDAVSYKKRVDTEAKRIVDFVSALEAPMKEARKAEDAAKEKEREEKAEKEKERVAAIEKDINTIRNVVLDCHGKTSLELSGIIGSLEETVIEVDRFAEHTPIAEAAKIEAIERLTELKEQALVTEKADEDRKVEDARLAVLRKKLEDDQAETQRKDDIKSKIQAIKDRGAYDPEATAEKILGRIHVLENTEPSKEVFQEFSEEAFMAKGLALSALNDFHTVAVEKERLAAVAAEEEAKALEEAADQELLEKTTASPEEEKVIETPPDADVVDAEFVQEEHVPSNPGGNEREIAVNFFIIKNVRKLQDGYYRVTLENQYVGTEDTDIIMAFSSIPEVGQKVQLVMEIC